MRRPMERVRSCIALLYFKLQTPIGGGAAIERVITNPTTISMPSISQKNTKPYLTLPNLNNPPAAAATTPPLHSTHFNTTLLQCSAVQCATLIMHAATGKTDYYGWMHE